MQDLIYFIRERHNVYRLKNAGRPKPWTKDPILQSYRFCNVYRELDTETRWIAENWRYPNQDDPDLWFAMAVARLVNWHGTLEQLGYPVPWKPKRFVDVLQARMCANQKTYTGAYIVSTNGNSLPKEHYLSEYVLTPLWKARKDIRPRADDALESFFRRLTQHRGMGGFMAGQVIADLKYAQLIVAPDWPTWAASGPGSRRGLNRVLERPVAAHWQEKAWHEELLKIQSVVNDGIRSYMADLHAQDLQNCLCEYSKYVKVKLGEGRPRSRYDGKGEKKT